MSRSEDYLDQLLKGVAPEDAAVEENLEENIFDDIFEELTDINEPQEENEEAVSEEPLKADAFGTEDVEDGDIFGDDFLDDDFLDDEFLKEFEMEMEKLETESDSEISFDDLDDILSGAKEQMELVEKVTEPEPIVEVEPVAEPEPAVAPVEELESILGQEESPLFEESPAFEESSPLEEDESLEALLGMTDIASAQGEEAEELVTEEPVADNGFDFSSLFAEDGESAATEPQEDADVLKILEGLDGIDLELEDEELGTSDSAGQDFSALEGFLAASAAEPQEKGADTELDGLASEESTEANDAKQTGGKKKAKKEKKSGEKTGFMNKLSLILFGEDDEDEEEVAGKKATDTSNVSIGVASEEDLALFGEYTEKAPSAPSAEDLKKAKKAEKEKKKKEKKEAKEKAKKEKKEKPPKPKKEKKPKPPKEPDNTPPLPKKPVFLIFLMVASFVALVVLGADLLGYSNQLTNAKNQYAKKNYSQAFAEISGIEIKEDDFALYEKYHVMAMVAVELDAYESLMSKEFYDMALDCLVRTVGRAEKYRADAEVYGCIQELNELELKAETILSETFGVSKEEALEFYAYRSKEDYSIAIKNVIKELGLER